METTTDLSPQHYNHDLDTMASPDNHFLKLEDVHASSPSSTFDNGAAQTSPPPPVLVNSKPAKKRKSWGQELPEPKTMLPPRKRAKTDDEKEQRRIERIKRNRAAAHNSRERKRQETETLAVALARANAELDAYRKLHGPLPSSVVLPEVMLTQFDDADTPAPSLIESRGSEAAASPASPALHDDLFTDNNVTIKQEPDLTYPALQQFDLPESTMKQGPALSLLDPTQHSAAMLCDLQCRSSQRSSSSSQTTPSASWWTLLFLHIMNLTLQTTYKSLLMAIWAHSPSRMARMMQASATRLTSRSTTSSTTTPLLLSRSTAALAQRNAATGQHLRRQGAYALQQRLVRDAGLRTENRPAAAAEQHHARHQPQQGSTTSKAFQEHDRERDVRDGIDGVGR